MDGYKINSGMPQLKFQICIGDIVRLSYIIEFFWRILVFFRNFIGYDLIENFSRHRFYIYKNDFFFRDILEEITLKKSL